MEQLYRDQLNLASNQEFYRGKVRDIYKLDETIVSLASNRISAFDHILPRPIPYKGQVLNQLAGYFLDAVRDIVPIWLEEIPHPTVSIGKYCEPIRIELVIRGYLAGHAWRTYKSGKRLLCGEKLVDGLKECDPLPTPIITPATKAESGHDEDISAAEIILRGLLSENIWNELCHYTHQLFDRGSQMANEVGLILVDTKYEFGIYKDQVYLIDEIHTPDSSRYYFLDGYEARQADGSHQEQLSKEFVREWLIAHDFQGLENQVMPSMPDDFVHEISARYISLYERLTGLEFIPGDDISDIEMESTIKDALDL